MARTARVFALVLFGWVALLIGITPLGPDPERNAQFFWLMACVAGFGVLALVLSFMLPEGDYVLVQHSATGKVRYSTHRSEALARKAVRPDTDQYFVYK